MIAGFISLYYNLLIAYSLIYAISSFMPQLPWTSCEYSWNNEKCCISSLTEVIVNNTVLSLKNCAADSESPAKQYFKYDLQKKFKMKSFFL